MSLSDIQLLILDVDGVLTDGKIFMGTDGQEYKAFHVRDGVGIKRLQQQGITIAVISGRKGQHVEARLQELGIQHYYLGIENKLTVFSELLDTLQLTKNQVAYMGDDLPDLPIMQQIAFKATVANAVPEVLNIADFISQYPGGEGAVRELCDKIIAAKQTDSIL